MMVRLMSTFAAVVLLAGCASAPEKEVTSTETSSASVTPSGPAANSTDYFKQVVGNTVIFDLDQYTLTNSSQRVLRGQASWLSQNPGRSVIVEGHCDERGTREYNLGLGDRRANSVKGYLVSLGVAASRVRTVSYGKERPLCVASNESCWSKNRRSVSSVR
jgi:peptidoglycan-associated lipoprotein